MHVSRRARRYRLSRSFSFRRQCASFSDSLAQTERPGVRQFGLGSGLDSLEFHDGPCPWERNRCIVDTPPGKTTAPLRSAGSGGGWIRLHARVRNSAAWRMVATDFPSALGAPAIAQPAALLGLVLDSAHSDDRDGLDASSSAGRSISETIRIRSHRRAALRIQYARRGGRCSSRRGLSGPRIWTFRHRLERRHHELHGSLYRLALFRRKPRNTRSNFTAIPVPIGIRKTAAVESAFCQHGSRRHSPRVGSNLASFFALIRHIHHYRFRYHARGRVSRNRPRRHQLQRDSAAFCTAATSNSDSFAPRRDWDAALLHIFSSAVSPTERSCIDERILAADRAIIIGIDVSSGLPLGRSAPGNRDLRSIRRERPDEQRRAHHSVQHHWRRFRTAARRFRVPAPAWLSDELDPCGSRLRDAGPPDEPEIEMVAAAGLWNRNVFAQRRVHRDIVDLSLPSRRNPFCQCSPSL